MRCQSPQKKGCAAWFLLHWILSGAGVEHVQLNNDIDSMYRAAFLAVFAEEVTRGDAHAFFVNYTKWVAENKPFADNNDRSNSISF